MHQISRVRTTGGDHITLEDEHRVTKLLKWLPAGPTEDGEGHRPRDLVQFIADRGGTRTVAAEDLVVL